MPDKCPKCGSTYGYFIRSRVSGHAMISFNWDGTDGDNTEMHEHIKYHDLKTKYCHECKAPINVRQAK